jgi:hypothetical protein
LEAARAVVPTALVRPAAPIQPKNFLREIDIRITSNATCYYLRLA